MHQEYVYTKHQLDIGTTGRYLKIIFREKELKNDITKLDQVILEKQNRIKKLENEIDELNKLFDQKPSGMDLHASGVTKNLSEMYYDMMEHSNMTFKLEPLLDKEEDDNDFVSLQADLLKSLTEEDKEDYTKLISVLLKYLDTIK